jgi:peptide alpha-N-acetyltransferase
MVEAFGAHYVSLHVRISNDPALHLYRDTLKFRMEKVEAKYYADGEDAFNMKQDLDMFRNPLPPHLQPHQQRKQQHQQQQASVEDAPDAAADTPDEGDEVGSLGKNEGDGAGSDKKAAAGGAGSARKWKVKVGRALGVGDLVERNEVAQKNT